MRRAGLLAAALVALGGAPALAGEAPPAAALGAWTFKTERYGPGCVLSGSMLITRKPGGALACRFTAREQCTAWDIEARQRCTVIAAGQRLSITSEVESTKPASASYLPDDFTLTVKNATEMHGAMTSVHAAPVVFRRPQAVPVS